VAIPNLMLNIMPYNCRYCVQGFKGMEYISQEARLCNLHLIELQKRDAEKQPVWDVLASMEPMFVNGFGHGNAKVYTGDSETTIFKTSECDILASRVVYLLSCLTAIELGPEIINIGGIAYGGYNISWTWMTSDITADPYNCRYAESFYRSTNEFPIALIQGETVNIAQERCMAEYNRWIEIWETERADDPYSANALKWLIHDRDGLTVLGDLNAVIIGVGIATILSISVEPPSNVHTNETFRIEGKLSKRETGSGLPNKLIELKEIGAEEPIEAIMTGETGGWAFDVSLDKGIHSMFIVFSGDDEYVTAHSAISKVEVGVTIMDVTIPPKPSADIDETILFAGNLIDKATGIGIPGRTVNLSGAVSDTAVTDSNGAWSFGIAFDTEGRHTLYVQFVGGADFIESATDKYQISIGILPAFGYYERGNLMRGITNRIAGSTFTAPEDGVAVALVPYIQYTAASNAKMRCALYRRSDFKLIGVTQEKQFLMSSGRLGNWEPFVLEGSPPIIRGEKYVLVGWASAAMLMYSLADTGWEGVEQDINHNDFPDPLVPFEFKDRKNSIYCEYKKEVNPMVVTFHGSVSAQAISGEEITITVTLPDGSIEQVVTNTLEDKTFSIQYSASAPGNYKAKARVEEDALYLAAESAEVPFVVGKQPRTITLTVS